jgi:hypothetical protein
MVPTRLLTSRSGRQPDHHEHHSASTRSYHSPLLCSVVLLALGLIVGCSPAASVSTSKPATSVSTNAPVSTNKPAASVSTNTIAVVPPGEPLPSDATCAAEVHPAAEVRPDNAKSNATPGTQKNLTGPYPLFSRVDGNFTGTTDEILQWTACKWGIDPDIVRAQAVVESYWHQDVLGDTTNNAAVCAPHHPIGSDPKQPGLCPESVGILQVRYHYWGNGFDEVENSTAYNADYTYAAWRSCFDGQETWLNTVDHVGTYGPGDIWGCLGVWFSGQWYTTPANEYISKVRTAFQQRTWTKSSFRNG